MNSDEEVRIPAVLVRKQVRTLTNDSDLKEVVLKGETFTKTFTNISEISLPSSSVSYFGQILLLHRLLVPEQNWLRLTDVNGWQKPFRILRNLLME